MKYVLPNSIQWNLYCPTQKAGRLCYYYCTKRSDLPVRDVDKECITEPNYETATYNYYNKCNQHPVGPDVKNGISSHILFFTKYEGKNHQYYNRIFIVGYYEIGWTTEINGRIAIKAKNLCFVPIEQAYEITHKRWRRINPGGKCLKIPSVKQLIYGNLFDEIVQHLDKQHNRVDDYRSEVCELSK